MSTKTYMCDGTKTPRPPVPCHDQRNNDLYVIRHPKGPRSSRLVSHVHVMITVSPYINLDHGIPGPLFNAKGHANSQAKEPVTPRPGGCVIWNSGRTESGRRRGGVTGGRDQERGVYSFIILNVLVCSWVPGLCFFAPRSHHSSGTEKNAKKSSVPGFPFERGAFFYSIFEKYM